MYNAQAQRGRQTQGIEDAHLKPAEVWVGLPLKGQSRNKISKLCASMASSPSIFEKHRAPLESADPDLEDQERWSSSSTSTGVP